VAASDVIENKEFEETSLATGMVAAIKS